jgi:hypothetical protein
MNAAGISGQGVLVSGSDGAVAVARAVGNPPKTAAIGHRDRHGVTAGRNHVAEWCGMRDRRHFVDKRGCFGSRKAAQQHGAFFELFLGALRRITVEKRDHNAVPSVKATLPEATNPLDARRYHSVLQTHSTAKTIDFHRKRSPRTPSGAVDCLTRSTRARSGSRGW